MKVLDLVKRPRLLFLLVCSKFFVASGFFYVERSSFCQDCIWKEVGPFILLFNKSAIHCLYFCTALPTTASTSSLVLGGFYSVTDTPVLTSLASDECIGGKEGFGYRLLKLEALNAGIGEIGVCVSCNSHLELVECFGQRKGLILSIDLCVPILLARGQ